MIRRMVQGLGFGIPLTDIVMQANIEPLSRPHAPALCTSTVFQVSFLRAFGGFCLGKGLGVVGYRSLHVAIHQIP